MKALPTEIEGFPRLCLSQTEERFMRLLKLGKPVPRASVIKAIWHGAPPASMPQALSAVAVRVRRVLQPLGFLLIYDQHHGSYTMIEDTRVF